MELDTNLDLTDIYESFNVAESLSNSDLDAIGQSVVRGYESDKTSRSEWEDNIDKWTQLALQTTEKKTTPFIGAANVKLPLITSAAMQFSARAYPALIPGTNAVRGRVVGFDYDGAKRDRAIRVGKHMSYQLLEGMPDWEEEMDRMLSALPIVGCMFKKTYFDTINGTNVSELVYPKELVVNYWAKNLDSADRITHVLKITDNEIHERVVGGVFRDVELKKVSPEGNGERESDKVTGFHKPSDEDETLPFIVLEQHCSLDLDGDGYREPYIVTVDYGSGEVLRIVARYSEQSITYNMDGTKVVRIVPDNYFTKFSFIPSPDGGFYDIGFGILLGPLNETANTLINQLLDAGTQSNMSCGLISRGIRLRKGDSSFQPGEWKHVNTTGDDLRKGIFTLPTREPSQVLFSLLGMIVETTEKLSSTTEIMSGEIPGQNTKATVAIAAIEQGMKVFSSIYKRIHRSLSGEYKKIYKLNSIYLSEEDYFNTLDIGQEQAMQIGLSDYASNTVDIVPTSDPNVATEQQRLSKVEALMQVMPLGLNTNEVKRRYLEATEQPNIEALMEQEDQGPTAEQQELELKTKMFEDESKRAWKELEIKEKAAASRSLKDIADAEGVEEGNQLDMYQTRLSGLSDLLSKEDKRRQQEEAAQQKLVQQEMMNQQKMRQREEAQQSKLENHTGGENVGSNGV